MCGTLGVHTVKTKSAQNETFHEPQPQIAELPQLHNSYMGPHYESITVNLVPIQVIQPLS